MSQEETTIGTISAEQMLAELEALDAPEPAGDEWKTRHEWKRLWQVGERRLARLLRQGIEAGKVECRMLPLRKADGTVQAYPHYRWKN